MSQAALSGLDWVQMGLDLDKEGYAVLPGLLSLSQVISFLASADRAERSPGRVTGWQLGEGSARRLTPPLPLPLDDLACELYERLAGISNRWKSTMNEPLSFPPRLSDLQALLTPDGLKVPQAIVSRLRAGEQEPLHQTAVGDHGFPLEISLLLAQPGEDFTGGEFVMTEQRPRMQSRPIVVPLNRGDGVIFAAAQRPFKGSKGFYRVNMKHAISRILSGQRLGVTIVFHGSGAADRDD